LRLTQPPRRRYGCLPRQTIIGSPRPIMGYIGELPRSFGLAPATQLGSMA
jgi:hypothetical protein